MAEAEAVWAAWGGSEGCKVLKELKEALKELKAGFKASRRSSMNSSCRRGQVKHVSSKYSTSAAAAHSASVL